jgi:HEAT repeat protein
MNEDANRKTMLRELMRLGDARAVDLFRASLDDSDEDVRAIAAQGLYRLRTPDAIDALVRTIDDSPDLLHYDVTPSVQALSKIGWPALPAVLPLLEAAEPRTRQHAEKVLRAIVGERGNALWRENGSYGWDAPEDERAESVRRWRQWLSDRAIS